MQNIFIVFLAAADKATPNFEGIEKSIAKDFGAENMIISTETEQLAAFLQNYNTDSQPLTITILAHGGPDGISTEQTKGNWFRLGYNNLLPLIAACRTNHALILNMTAPCFSYKVMDHLADHPIDEVWYTTNKSDSLHKGLTAAKEGYKSFKFMDTQDLYHRYLRQA